MRNLMLFACVAALLSGPSRAFSSESDTARSVAINARDTGYRGIWYMNQPSHDKYVYKYSGGLGTFCAKHQPFAVYCAKAEKTFFCYGGATREDNRHLLHMVSFFDHRTGMVPRPTVLLDKITDDAHDNPVISVDQKGYIWIFSTAHGTNRPAYIHRSRKPYDIDEFELVRATTIEGSDRVPITNFSYMQPWSIREKGFFAFFTRYNCPAARTIFCMSSPDGETWSAGKRLAVFGEGHYQISGFFENIACTTFNYHPQGKGVNWRTNLYYLETTDFGGSFHTAGGQKLTLPLKSPDNPALVNDYSSKGLNVYLKDIRLDQQRQPVILFLTSRGYEAGPKNAPRTWTTARWTGKEWEINPAMESDNNYDTGSLYLEPDGTWRIIGPTETGPQPYNPGGEIAMWVSGDRGKSWKKLRQLTQNSRFNHTYVRRPVNAHPGFYALWADGHGRKPSESNLYFCDREGRVYRLPREMKGKWARPFLLNPDRKQ
ncbi:MAG: BNR-4 repeat-containing protein [Gemmatimonadota bacterium]|nr:BNR-4 repeat-containing protein [Gemmatimonadota bacterium]